MFLGSKILVIILINGQNISIYGNDTFNNISIYVH